MIRKHATLRWVDLQKVEAAFRIRHHDGCPANERFSTFNVESHRAETSKEQRENNSADGADTAVQAEREHKDGVLELAEAYCRVMRAVYSGATFPSSK